MLGFVLVLTVFVLLFWVAFNHYKVHKLKNAACATWAEIDAKLKVRHRNIANLLGTFKDGSKSAHDLEAILGVLQAYESTDAKAPDKDWEGKESELSELLSEFLFGLEQRPEILQKDDYLKIQEVIVATEDELALLCVKYNDLAVGYNFLIKALPYSAVFPKDGTKALLEFQVKDVFAKHPLAMVPSRPTPKKSLLLE